MHPRLAEPNDKEEWRKYLVQQAPPEPVMPTYTEYLSMSDLDKRRFNRTRSNFHSAGVIVRTPDVEKLHYELSRRLEVNRCQPAGARRGKVIDGPPTTGKSTLIKWFAADYENELRELEPELFVTDEGKQYARDYVPVVYISLGSQYTPKDLSTAIADFLMVPYRAGATKTQITTQIIKAMRICGTELVIVDEFHYLDLSAKEGKAANDHLKHLANHTAATFVYCGHDLEESGLFLEGRSKSRATQTAARNDLHKIDLFKIDTEPQLKEWVKTIVAMDAGLRLFHHEPGSLARHWRYIHDRTGGSLAGVSLLIRESAIEAVLSGAEAITVELMERIKVDLRGDEHRAATLKRRASKKPKRLAPPEPPATEQAPA